MAVTYVSALERDTRRTSEIARSVDARHALLAVTSLVAMLALSLAYVGSISRSVRLEPDLRSSDRRSININALKDETSIERVLEPTFVSAGDRRRAATKLYAFVRSQDVNGGLPNVGALRRATLDGKAPVLTSDQLTTLKPSIVVRTQDAHREQLLVWGAVYLASVWAVALFWWARGVRGDALMLSAAHLLTALGFAVLLSRQDPLRDTMLFVRYA